MNDCINPVKEHYVAEGPYFEDLRRGQVYEDGLGVELTDGLAAAHRAIVGDRLALALDPGLARAVTGSGPLAHPAVVWDVSIGQSTIVTHHVLANLFYRRLLLHRLPAIGDVISTRVTVDGLKQNRVRPDRTASGLAVLHIQSEDGRGRRVLDYWRCAMLPLRDSDAVTGMADDVSAVGEGPSPQDELDALQGWDVGPAAMGGAAALPQPGQRWQVAGGDVVSSGPELARLTLNIASAHHDAARAGGVRLVYGGHTIGLALSQASRAFPSMLTIVSWRSCDHTGPVHEGDTVRSTLEIEDVRARPEGGWLVGMRSRMTADDPASTPRNVLDWRFVALFP